MQLRTSYQIGESPVTFKKCAAGEVDEDGSVAKSSVGQVVLAGGGEALELLESGVLWLGREYLYAISCAPSLRGIRQATMIRIDRSEAGSRYCCS